jgi:hypothetical protein
LSNVRDRQGNCLLRADRSIFGPSRWGIASGRQGRTVIKTASNQRNPSENDGARRVGQAYLSAGSEILPLGQDTFVIIDIVLPAVLCPAHTVSGALSHRQMTTRRDVLVLIGKACIVAWSPSKEVSRCRQELWCGKVGSKRSGMWPEGARHRVVLELELAHQLSHKSQQCEWSLFELCRGTNL